MSRLMDKAIERLRALPEGQQDVVAEFVLHELSEDERWAKTSDVHREGVHRPVDRLRADEKSGRCGPMDPERM